MYFQRKNGGIEFPIKIDISLKCEGKTEASFCVLQQCGKSEKKKKKGTFISNNKWL